MQSFANIATFTGTHGECVINVAVRAPSSRTRVPRLTVTPKRVTLGKRRSAVIGLTNQPVVATEERAFWNEPRGGAGEFAELTSRLVGLRGNVTDTDDTVGPSIAVGAGHLTEEGDGPCLARHYDISVRLDSTQGGSTRLTRMRRIPATVRSES